MYRSLLDHPAFGNIEIVAATPNRQAVFRRERAGPISGYLGRLDLSPEPDGGTTIRCHADVDPVMRGTAWLSQRLVARDISRLVRRLATVAADRDYDAPPY